MPQEFYTLLNYFEGTFDSCDQKSLKREKSLSTTRPPWVVLSVPSQPVIHRNSDSTRIPATGLLWIFINSIPNS
ncbi:Hypothetical predicted protein [Octopus vulgaris]|uniref:Uncharacterized protein n=1 Tax=Octopus vulgaris TaxID=6645 RepID=A0AA36FKA3_OCTVU|nr:Hypothetical predicted protein [Octopus vulgaris]